MYDTIFIFNILNLYDRILNNCSTKILLGQTEVKRSLIVNQKSNNRQRILYEYLGS